MWQHFGETATNFPPNNRVNARETLPNTVAKPRSYRVKCHWGRNLVCTAMFRKSTGQLPIILGKSHAANFVPARFVAGNVYG